jgi:hypothetical protein
LVEPKLEKYGENLNKSLKKEIYLLVDLIGKIIVW